MNGTPREPARNLDAIPRALFSSTSSLPAALRSFYAVQPPEGVEGPPCCHKTLDTAGPRKQVRVEARQSLADGEPLPPLPDELVDGRDDAAGDHPSAERDGVPVTYQVTDGVTERK